MMAMWCVRTAILSEEQMMAGLRMDTIDSSWLQVRRRRELFEMCTWAEGAVCNVYLLTELYVFESVGNIH